MADQYGYVYKIINDVNDMVYVGETMRSLPIRFNEHCFDSRSTSILHKAIKEIGWQHFKIVELEKVKSSDIYTREKYWIDYYDSYKSGYNSTPDGKCFSCDEYGQYNNRDYYQILVEESGLIFDSLESISREITEFTGWGYAKKYIKKCLDENRMFLDFHLKRVRCDMDNISSIEDRENWIKDLNLIYQGKHIYCNELDMDFQTVGQCAKYLFDNGYYTGDSKTPIQSIITSICKQIKGKIEFVNSTKGELTFEELPGSTKNTGSENPFEKRKVKCIELNMEFESSVAAAHYMVDRKLWDGIRFKTAKLRVSDILRGVFPNYKGYSFCYIKD